MLLVQKYNSLDEIDGEFKDSLESLIASDLPNLPLLNDFEKRSPTELIFYYYLFFGHQHNRPVGFFFAQLSPLPENDFLSFKQRMIKKIKKTDPPKLLRLTGPGRTGAFWFFEPKYIGQGLKEVNKILTELKTSNILLTEEISTDIHPAFINGQTISEKHKILLSPINLKNNSYENYFTSLGNEEKAHVKNIWKNLTQNKNLEIEEITESFKLPRAEGISIYLKLDSQFIGLKENGETKGLIIFTRGCNHVLFVDFIVVAHSDNFPPMSYLQNALMKAFDFSGYDQLVFSKAPAHSETYLGLSIEVLELYKFSLIKQTYQLNVHSPQLLENIGKHDLSKYTTDY